MKAGHTAHLVRDKRPTARNQAGAGTLDNLLRLGDRDVQHQLLRTRCGRLRFGRPVCSALDLGVAAASHVGGGKDRVRIRRRLDQLQENM